MDDDAVDGAPRLEAAVDIGLVAIGTLKESSRSRSVHRFRRTGDENPENRVHHGVLPVIGNDMADAFMA